MTASKATPKTPTSRSDSSKNHDQSSQNPFKPIALILEAYREHWGDTIFLNTLRQPEIITLPAASSVLVKHLPEEAVGLFVEALSNDNLPDVAEAQLLEPLIAHACDRIEAENLKTDGGDLVDMIGIWLRSKDIELHNKLVAIMAPLLLPPKNSGVRSFFSLLASEDFGQHLRTQAQFEEILTTLIQHAPDLIVDQLNSCLKSKSLQTRLIAIQGLIKTLDKDPLEHATQLFTAKSAAKRQQGLLFLRAIGPETIPLLRKGLEIEKVEKLQIEIEDCLRHFQADFTPKTRPIDDSPEALFDFIENSKPHPLPSLSWIDLKTIVLIDKNDEPLHSKVFSYLVAKQAKHKTIDAAPGILPVLELLDREKNADSALALLNQWLDSDQVAKDRWALVLAGLLGDNRIIPALTPRIQPWCENARHKLAEYAAQAISLLATEEALMILDTLANRYRSKFKNIGKACNAAFLAAAEARGVTPDELGDLVVPDLGFNSECHKEFDDGKIIAVLQPDFKITWLNPETEKETKSPPSNLSDAGKEELKTLRKILREAVKGQTARLEQMLVRQRRWPVARWQELFEEHPLLQSYAANLVWGIYDPNSELLRTFRRYPNGILAHGTGEMEDLEERDTQIGLVHPLELDDKTIGIWRDHLGRFKVKPPFPQLDRPVEVLEDDHGNRREITFTENVQISGGTFLSRMNKRGWIRGSVIDAGGVTCYYKPFEGAGAEAILFLEEYWVGFDPVDSFPLGKALFATLSTVDRGSYIYDDPQPNDPRVLPFGKVPPIVYSEIIADLKALIEGQTKS